MYFWENVFAPSITGNTASFYRRNKLQPHAVCLYYKTTMSYKQSLSGLNKCLCIQLNCCLHQVFDFTRSVLFHPCCHGNKQMFLTVTISSMYKYLRQAATLTINDWRERCGVGVVLVCGGGVGVMVCGEVAGGEQTGFGSQQCFQTFSLFYEWTNQFHVTWTTFGWNKPFKIEFT